MRDVRVRHIVGHLVIVGVLGDDAFARQRDVVGALEEVLIRVRGLVQRDSRRPRGAAGLRRDRDGARGQ